MLLDNPIQRTANMIEERVNVGKMDGTELARKEKQAIAAGGEGPTGRFVKYGLFNITPWDDFIFGA